VFEWRNTPPHPSLVYCGDDAEAKTVAAALIRDAGFDPVDAGPLRLARYTEPFALLVGRLAYSGVGGGPELCYRFARLRPPA
jgi:predicted dinucleotide-binding enzyme